MAQRFPNMDKCLDSRENKRRCHLSNKGSKMKIIPQSTKNTIHPQWGQSFWESKCFVLQIKGPIWNTHTNNQTQCPPSMMQNTPKSILRQNHIKRGKEGRTHPLPKAGFRRRRGSPVSSPEIVPSLLGLLPRPFSPLTTLSLSKLVVLEENE